jgi:hypothetical protein
MNQLSIFAVASAFFVTPVCAADLPMEMSGLNPQPLPPIAEPMGEPAEAMAAESAEPMAAPAEAMAAESAEPMAAEPVDAAPAMAEAPDSRVRITNTTGESLVELYTSRAGARNWQTDVLGGRQVAPGAAVTVNFANGAGICEFDVRAVFGDGVEQVVEGLDACAVGEINFSS